MTGDELRAALGRLGWSGAELARRQGRGANAVSAWVTGKRPVPDHIIEYLRVMEQAREAQEALANITEPTTGRR